LVQALLRGMLFHPPADNWMIKFIEFWISMNKTLFNQMMFDRIANRFSIVFQFHFLQ
jgi:hypothetical protein